MLERTKKHSTETTSEARFIGTQEKIALLRKYARKIGLRDATETVSVEEAFPEYVANPAGTVLCGYRHREGLTQVELAKQTGIPQRHISEMEHGKRTIGKEAARKLASVLHCDYRMLL
jgi:DNA-binding XRE family transcriptional regulator